MPNNDPDIMCVISITCLDALVNVQMIDSSSINTTNIKPDSITFALFNYLPPVPS
jgi:hypothetical protein